MRFSLTLNIVPISVKVLLAYFRKLVIAGKNKGTKVKMRGHQDADMSDHIQKTAISFITEKTPEIQSYTPSKVDPP